MRMPITLALLGLLWSGSLVAQQLGHASFPNSGAASAQPDFIRGLLFLHSFEYADAAEAFRAAQSKDPAFALAYWGEALTYTHPIWDEQDSVAARAVLRRFGATTAERLARIPAGRERAWFATAESLYGQGSKAQRDTLFEAAVAELARKYPTDDEAKAFDALALMGLSQGIRSPATYDRAGKIALDLLRRHPDHPGAAHYVIHAYDDPAHASIALPAARAYSRIAPGAAHAQHMTTHIFLALGMWPEVISQNLIASGPDTSKWLAGHYTDWLGYAYLQQGQADRAAALLGQLRAHLAPDASAHRQAALSVMVDEYLVNSERWNDPVLAWTLDDHAFYWVAQAQHAFTRGFAAHRRGAAGEAHDWRARLSAIADSIPGDLNDGLDHAQVATLAAELVALDRRQAGDTSAAIAGLMRAAASYDSLPVEFGPPTVLKPPHELLGEMLLDAGRRAEATDQFRLALAQAPGRRLAQRGLGQATGKVPRP